MMKATAGQPDKDFPVPPGITFAKICQDTGRPYDGKCARWIDEAFAEGAPQPVEDTATEPEGGEMKDFYNSELGGAAAPKAASPAGKIAPKPADNSGGF
jgi:membrane carboxypeptidase/penicillin-binding protein